MKPKSQFTQEVTPRLVPAAVERREDEHDEAVAQALLRRRRIRELAQQALELLEDPKAA